MKCSTTRLNIGEQVIGSACPRGYICKGGRPLSRSNTTEKSASYGVPRGRVHDYSNNVHPGYTLHVEPLVGRCDDFARPGFCGKRCLARRDIHVLAH